MTVIQHNHFAFITILSFFAMGLLGYAPRHITRVTSSVVEICDNALDDDGDGLIDLWDPDCVCVVVDPVSLIPNPSFEDMNCCPDRQSQLDCASVWIQASLPTTDFIHMCGWMGWPEFPPPLPFPDGEGIMGFRDGRVRNNTVDPEYNWKEYAGACLLGPLLADTPYVFEFYVGFVDRFKSPDINITFFGTSDCANLPFGIGNEAFGCPTNGPGWVNLGSSFVSGGTGNKWVKTTIEVVPQEDITAIAIGPDCPEVQSSISIYYFFDNLKLVDFRSFQFRISELTAPCADEFFLQVPLEPGVTYQWYKDGIALVGETSYQMENKYGEGDFQAIVMKGGSCRLTGIYRYTIPQPITKNVVKSICKEDVYPFGNRLLNESGFYVDTFKNIHHCDSIVYLDLHVGGNLEDTLRVKIFEGEVYKNDTYKFTTEGDYLLNLTTTQGCDSLVQLHLEYYHVFIPNVFSPNGDGVNDVFNVTGGNGQIELNTLSVYDRWGGQIFEGPEWDGRNSGVEVNPGVYTYKAVIKMSDGIERQFSGSVTLIR